jgi:CRISPR-associated protein Cas2
MYIILTYDAGPKRGIKLLKFLRENLIWVQNSVFEGEVTESGLERIKTGIKERMNPKKDSIIYYVFDSPNYIERSVLGQEKNEIDSFV